MSFSLKVPVFLCPHPNTMPSTTVESPLVELNVGIHCVHTRSLPVSIKPYISTGGDPNESFMRKSPLLDITLVKGPEASGFLGTRENGRLICACEWCSNRPALSDFNIL
ncbi:hypothetical protein Ahy_B05g078774 isoform C [Arachis hypogaea]|uniref:Uncharacterized protein n=1 Tax=Arachis hypogaea TaxID=3818 RepID=A0A444Z822_ARAHY|nr:hypothetical protein Ahy_B05g078774 isoform C [Arachis hypogaea]